VARAELLDVVNRHIRAPERLDEGGVQRAARIAPRLHEGQLRARCTGSASASRHLLQGRGDHRQMLLNWSPFVASSFAAASWSRALSTILSATWTTATERLISLLDRFGRQRLVGEPLELREQ
jgi:hypothetical protein